MFAIRRPVFSIVLSILAVIAGLFAMFTLPIAQYPNITPPTVQVQTSYPGASPQLVATTVGAPIEQAVNGVEGMMYMSSSSTQGSYALTITFEVGTDIDMATIHVQNKLNTVLSSLPEPTQKEGIQVNKAASNMLVIFSLTSPDGRYDDLYLTNYASLNLSDPLKRVEGVGNVTLFGSSKYSIRVWMDPEVLRLRRVSAADVYNAIASQNLESTAGAVGQAPLASPIAFTYTLVAPGQLTDVDEFEQIIVRSTETGQYLRLGEVAKVELGSQTYTSSSKYSGRACAMISVNQTPGANALDVANGVIAEMEQLKAYLPDGVDCEVALNTTEYILESIDEVVLTLFETLAIVMVVILFFLQNWRAVLIPAVTIPVSLIATFGIMALLGFSLNLLTLFGMVLAIAIVVDDAIVVVENAERLLDAPLGDDGTAGTDVATAVEQAVRELIGPIISIDLCMLGVFVPSSFISGITGELIRQFALTIAASTLISGFVSLTLTPTLCVLLLRRHESHSKPVVFRWFDRGYAWVAKVYDYAMQWLLDRPGVALLIFAAIALPSLVLYDRHPTTFLPTEDQGYFMVMVQLPDAASTERTQAVMDDLCNKYVKTLPGVAHYVQVTGYSMMGGASNNSGMVWVILEPWSQRKGKHATAEELVDRINAEGYYGVPQAMVYAVNPPPIQGLGVSGGLSLELEDRNNLGAQALFAAYEKLLGDAGSLPSVGRINSFYSPNVPQYELVIDRSRLRMLELTFEQVSQTLAYYLGTAYVNDYVAFGRVWQVILGGETQARATLQKMQEVSVTNSQGESVPLASFLKLQYQTGPASITRYNLYNSASIDLSLKGNASSGNAIAETEQWFAQHLGTEFGYEWTSTALQELESGKSVMLVFLLAFMLVYLVLAAQYESWTASIAVLMSVPLAVTGIVIGCSLWGLPVSIYTQIGLILLIALSAKNAILIVAFGRDAMKKNSNIKRAALDAGNIRLRPIMMTSLAFVFGVMPLMFATGPGASSRIAIGVAVVFGMAANGILGTLFVPNFFDLMQRLEQWGKRITCHRSCRHSFHPKSSTKCPR